MSARNMSLRDPGATQYSLHVELDRKVDPATAPDVASRMLDVLADHHPAVGLSPRGWLDAQITVPAASLPAAVRLGCALVVDAAREAGVDADVVAVQVMTEEEFAVRQHWLQSIEDQDGEEVLSTGEVATLLGVSPARVGQLVRDGKLAGRKLGARSWVYDRTEVDRFLLARA